MFVSGWIFVGPKILVDGFFYANRSVTVCRKVFHLATHGWIGVYEFLHFTPTMHHGAMITAAKVLADLLKTTLNYVISQVYGYIASRDYCPLP